MKDMYMREAIKRSAEMQKQSEQTLKAKDTQYGNSLRQEIKSLKAKI